MKDRNQFDTQERRWIDLAQKDDLDAFNHLVLCHQDAAFRLASWMLKEDTLAEDIVQAGFLAAYGDIHHFRGGSFRAWLLRIIRNLCIDELRHRARHPWIPLEPKNADGQDMEDVNWLVDQSPSPEDIIVEHEDWKKVENCIQQLSDPMREVLILIDIEEFDYQEAATVLKLPLGTIKSRLGRARARLRALLGEGFISSVISGSHRVVSDLAY